MNSVKDNLVEAFRSVGLTEGDTVFIHANLLSFGLVASEKKGFVEYFLSPLREVIGESGTIAVMTYTFSYAGGKTPFSFEESPSEAGMLTEYIRTLPNASRSMHPLCSVSAIGPNAEVITGGKTRSAFGWGSPFQKLHELKAKCLFLGMTAGQSFTFLHYIEHLYGVSHCYHKAFFHPAMKEGKIVEGPFLAFLRNRNAEPYDFTRFEEEMRGRGHLSECTHKEGRIQGITLQDAFTVGMEMLANDACAFLKAPFYITE